jgi:L-malate glycosyltransferase
MSARSGAPRILHIFGSSAVNSPPAQRATRLIEAFGGRLAHTVVAADDDFSAMDGLTRGIRLQRLASFPPLGGLPLPGRLQRVARALQDYDLVLTYGRGAMDAALAHTMFSQVHALPPLIHHEDGSDETARQRKGWRSRWSRRVGLGKAAGLVVPTETMEHAALVDWQQPIGRVKRIADGVDLDALRKSPKGDAIPRLIKRPGEIWLGCQTHFDGSDAPQDLLEALHSLDDSCHLVVVGNGPKSAAFQSQVTALALDHRVHVVPQLRDPDTLVRLADVVVLSGGCEPLPLLAIAAMAAAKPLAGFDTPTGEVATCVAGENAGLIARPGDIPATIAVLSRLTSEPHLRQKIGHANRAKAEAAGSDATMIAAYRRLYASALGVDEI